MAQDVSITREEIDKLVKQLEKGEKVVSDARAQAMREAAQKLKALVDRRLGGTGKVQSWQGVYLGSRGGYAAVRPKANTFTPPGRKTGRSYAVGYVTNAIESGHRFPTPGGQARYKPRIRSWSTRVEGKGFYAAARADTGEIVREAGEQVVQALLAALDQA